MCCSPHRLACWATGTRHVAIDRATSRRLSSRTVTRPRKSEYLMATPIPGPHICLWCWIWNCVSCLFRFVNKVPINCQSVPRLASWVMITVLILKCKVEVSDLCILFVRKYIAFSLNCVNGTCLHGVHIKMNLLPNDTRQTLPTWSVLLIIKEH